MQTATKTLQPEIGVSLLSGTLLSPLPMLLQRGSAEITFPYFHLSLPVSLVEISPTPGSRQITIKVEVDNDVWMVCLLNQGLTNGHATADTEATVYFQKSVDPTTDHPRAAFIELTLQAMLWLAGSAQLRIPTLGGDIQLSFTAPLREVGQALSHRQLAYRLMVIEQAFDLRLANTFYVPADVAERVDFVYHAVTDRSFDWQFIQGMFPYQATEQAELLLSDSEQPNDCLLNLVYFYEELLGNTLSLGPAKITVKDAVIANTEELRHELKLLDGHEFQVCIKSLTGTANYHFPDAPHLPINSWDELVGNLVKLQDKLVDSFFNAVNELAAATLSDLTEEEKAAVTERFSFDEEAFDDPEFEVEN